MEKRERSKAVVNENAVKVKKPTMGKKLASMFFTSDFDSVKKWVLEDKIIPGAKNLFLDTLSMILTGDSRSRSAGKTDYTKVYVGGSSSTDSRKDMARARSDYHDLVFVTREDAILVINSMKETIDDYGTVSILDLFDLAGSSLGRSTDNYYGWRDMPEPASEYVVGTSAGFELRLPPVMALRR